MFAKGFYEPVVIIYRIKSIYYSRGDFVKKLSLLFLFVLLFLTSCSSSPAPIARSFSAQVSATSGTVDIKGKITANKENLFVAQVYSPNTMKGYTYTYKNSKLRMEYKGMIVDAEEGYLPDSAFPAVIYNVLKSLNKENNCYLSSSDNALAVYKGKSDSGDFILTAEFTTGAVKKIEVESIGFTAEFSNIKLIN